MWSDKETLHDCLGYSSYVEVLAHVCTRCELAPLTLGIFGAWGSGKTSLMAMLKYRMDRDADVNKMKTLWFNAWKYEGPDEAQSALIHAVIRKLIEGRTLAEESKATLSRLLQGASVLKLAKFITKTAVTLTPDLKGFLDCFKDQSEKVAETMEQFDQDFRGLLSEIDVGHIVVFIDDLDRCPSSKVIETFETIKLFLNTPQCTFVIGADPERIEQAVGDVYGVVTSRRTKDYLEKIIQLPFNIPVQNPQDIACYVGMLIIGRHLGSTSGWNAFIAERSRLYQAGSELSRTLLEWVTKNEAYVGPTREVIEKELAGIVPYVGILGGGLRGNPRQIKRFLNILALRRQFAEANKLEADDAILVKMTVLEYVWDDFFNALVETVDPATGHSPLLEELAKEDVSVEGDQSDLVAKFAEKIHLLAFLRSEPPLSAGSDLRPYLFLAQTSISRGKQVGLLPPDEKALEFAKAISGADRVMSKAAALRAGAEDIDIVASVIRHLTNILGSSTENRTRTHILTGLDAICAKHPRFYGDVVKTLEKCDPGGSDAVGVAGSTLLANAETYGISVSPDVKENFTKAAGALGAISGGKRARPRGR